MPKEPTYEELEQKIKELTKEANELRQVEKDLHDSEERFRIMVENANEAIAIIQDGVIKYGNPKVVERSGFTPDRFASMSFLDFIHPDDKAIALDRSNRRMKGEPVSDNIVYKLVDKDGKPYWDYVRFVEIVWDGKPALMVLMIDITELKEAEEALKEARVKLEQRVKERTTDLEKANELLGQEIEERKKVEFALRESEKELKLKTNNLEEVNTALKVLLKRREKDKIELEEKVLLNVKELVEPYLVRLTDSRLNEEQETYASIMKSNLKDIISPFIHSLTSRYLNLTPSEVQVANLIKQGRNTKEIANLLNLSDRTVKFHRENIRKKIGIKNSKANLRTHLISLH
jgi:PAS domain S-box-containing protein